MASFKSTWYNTTENCTQHVQPMVTYEIKTKKEKMLIS